MIQKQREAVYEKMKAISNSHRIYPGLNFSSSTAAAAASASAAAASSSSASVAVSAPAPGSSSSSMQVERKHYNIEDIPGVKEAGYKPSRQSSRFQAEARPSPLTDLQAKLGAVLKVR
jgi:hypothetical protein